MIKYIVVALLVGGVAGYVNSNYGSIMLGNFVSDYLFNASLLLLLFIMGVAFGMDKESIAKMKRAGFRILLFPFAVALGSILGGVVSGLILGINITASMAVSAGYGWYTLAGPLTNQLFGAEWGALGFTVNFLRELFTIMTISLIVRVDKYAPIALGGATTMDTTLPIIVRYCGSDTLITSFSSGFVLSIIAPFTITAIAALPH
ncbi:MAG: lysine exporter LysO family protein [Candidatus Bathyarchaeota archaeon]|nr:lysine exporter LysO family protein [Candidatus Bathyarchaeota archaeon]